MNVVNTKGQTTLHIVALQSNNKTINVLMLAGINFKLHNNDWLTVLGICHWIFEDREQEVEGKQDSRALPAHDSDVHVPLQWPQNYNFDQDTESVSDEEDWAQSPEQPEQPDQATAGTPCRLSAPFNSPLSLSSVSAVSDNSVYSRNRTPSEAPSD